MLARKCDRCKEFYTYIPDLPDRYKIVRVSDTASRYTKSLDLCSECEAKLKIWFENVEEE